MRLENCDFNASAQFAAESHGKALSVSNQLLMSTGATVELVGPYMDATYGSVYRITAFCPSVAIDGKCKGCARKILESTPEYKEAFTYTGNCLDSGK